MPTYKQQYDKLTEAYIHNRVRPYNACACFVGNMLNNTTGWRVGIGCFNTISSHEDSVNYSRDSILENSDGIYTLEEIIKIEKIFLQTIHDNCTEMNCPYIWITSNIHKEDPNYENALFIAFERTLEYLKEIHISKGEIVEETPIFVKRTLKAEATI